MTAMPITAAEAPEKDDDLGPTFVPMVRVGKVLENGDSIKYVEMNNIYVYGSMNQMTEKQRKAFNRLVNNVKKVLPIAKEVNRAIIETYEYMQTLPTKEEREAHMKLVEKGIKAQYGPRMKKLTLAQGKLLIKLIHRETNSSSYQLVKAFLGATKAAFYQTFAWMFGASLKKEYDPQGKDRMTERVVRLVEAGQI
jgi:hypothetical protein